MNKQTFLSLVQMSQQNTPTKKVSYFSHFPYYFLRPYDAQQRVTSLGEVLAKLTPKNCEWVSRPNIAISEMAQAVSENLVIAEASPIFNDNVRSVIFDKITPYTETLQHLNSHDKTTTPSPHDVYNIMQFALTDDPEMDNLLEETMQSCAAMCVLSVHLRVLRSVAMYPQLYADKLTSDDPHSILFKQQQNIPALQNMFTNLTCRVPPAYICFKLREIYNLN